MKKILIIILAIIVGVVLGDIIYHIFNKDKENAVEDNTAVETLIKEDMSYFDNMSGKVIFYESRVALNKPFNEGDKFVAQEVTNIFQQNLDDGKGNFTTNVYEFKHIPNYGEVDIQIHEGTFVLEDEPINLDTLKLTFNDAYIKAKESDIVPSKSCYMVLRSPLGPTGATPTYIIGNNTYGLMCVDAINGQVRNNR